MIKVMISQPMKGKTEEQIKDERARFTEFLKGYRNDFEIIDTIFTDEVPDGMDKLIYYLGKSIEAMSQADLVAFMPGWKNARGCRIEYMVAKEYEKPVIDFGNKERKADKEDFTDWLCDREDSIEYNIGEGE